MNDKVTIKIPRTLYIRHFKVHIKTFKSYDRARQYVNNVKPGGKELEILPLPVSLKETWYRVMATPFLTRDEASKFIREMIGMGVT